MHMLRLGYQGIELLETGSLSFPMREPEREWLRGVRVGKVGFQECLTRVGELEAQIKDLIEESPVRIQPDAEAVEKWMLRVYFRYWSAARCLEDYREDAEHFKWKRDIL